MKEINEAARALGKLGGKKSAEARLGGKTKEQKSELMRRVRLSKRDRAILLDAMLEEQKTHF